MLTKTIGFGGRALVSSVGRLVTLCTVKAQPPDTNLCPIPPTVSAISVGIGGTITIELGVGNAVGVGDRSAGVGVGVGENVGVGDGDNAVGEGIWVGVEVAVGNKAVGVDDNRRVGVGKGAKLEKELQAIRVRPKGSRASTTSVVSLLMILPLLLNINPAFVPFGLSILD
ncbi:MAG: hypothetical protein HYU86_10575 [Chloroflexi bacterium]|nr:hypothetical protein [Chloroflexota bacterium]